tara:strand:+ start:8029 stop:9912 length:1884 start_codon:yes stop_codon:yes gene_type:complete
MFFINKLLTLPPLLRRLILVCLDFSFLFFTSFIVFKDKLLFFENKNNFLFICLITIIGISLYILNGQYKSLSKFLGSKEIYRLILRNFYLIILIWFLNYAFKAIDLSPEDLFIFWVIINSATGFLRLISRDILINLSNRGNLLRKKSIIFGAGMAGAQLFGLLRLSNKYSIKYFVDDNPELWNREINGIKILSRQSFKKTLQKESIDQILFAIPSLKNSQKVKVLNYLREFKIPILQIPSLDDLNIGNEKISSLKSINIEDFLGRDVVIADSSLLDNEFKNKNICVFGAAGSIGFEICKQIFKQDPKTLIFFDHSEIGIYNLTQYFQKIKPSKTVNIIPILGSCLDSNLVERIFDQYKIDIVFHAAAYKHVPLVQLNPIQGIQNNIFSTLIICKAAVKTSVRKVLLISTDKAVRPTNIMGASKRVAEMILQAFNKEFSINNKSTIFSMVRFGNVLNSSGSVIPLFEKQIKQGGPITVTHPKITRYFMTIKEASELVLQSSSLASGGEVFLLDMGSPVLIADLAKQLINLNGHVLKDKKNPNGDIEIVYTGLRPGEKLYEELLVDADAQTTKHPLIFKANEKFLNYDLLSKKIDELKLSIKNQNLKEVKKILLYMVPQMKLYKEKVNY